MGQLGSASLTRRACLTLGLSSALLAQPSPPVFRVNVKLVRLLATVKRASGELVGGLDQSDFSIEDSGVPQQIALFERRTEQPLSIALLIDTSGSTAKELKYEIDSASRFLRALTREGNPQDALSLYSFNHDVTLQTGFTRDARRLQRALARLKAEAGTSIYDALWFAADALQNRDGRKVIVIVTDGGDTTSAHSYHDALRAMHAADAVLYAIVVVPIPNDAGRNVGGENALISMTRSTGGRTFFPAVGPTLDQAFTDILRDLRTQYLLGYYPRGLPPPPPNGFRPIRLTVNQPDLQALSRGGYYEE